jgi:hypothetical protein
MLGNSLDKYNKSCSSPHKESSKIEFAFLRFSYNFLEVLQESAKSFYYWSSHFAPGPLDLFPPSQLYPWFAQNTPERFGGLQSYPWPWGRRGSPESGEAGGAPGRGKGRARLGAHLGRRGGRGLSGGGSGEHGCGVGRRRPLRTGCRWDGGAGGARRGSGNCSRSLGRFVRACTTLWKVAGRSSPRRRPWRHDGAAVRVRGLDRRWRRGDDSQDAAVLQRSSADARTAGPRTDRWSAACTVTPQVFSRFN